MANVVVVGSVNLDFVERAPAPHGAGAPGANHHFAAHEDAVGAQLRPSDVLLLQPEVSTDASLVAARAARRRGARDRRLAHSPRT